MSSDANFPGVFPPGIRFEKDPSAITRIIRRVKYRSDARSKYKRHSGSKEQARRLKQLAAKANS